MTARRPDRAGYGRGLSCVGTRRSGVLNLARRAGGGQHAHMVLLRSHAVVITSARGNEWSRLHIHADIPFTAWSLSSGLDDQLDRATPLAPVEAAREPMSEKGECGPIATLSAPPAEPLGVRTRALRRAKLRWAALASVEK